MAEARRFTKPAFQEWINSRQTRVFLALLKADRDRMADQWARGVPMDLNSQVRARLLQDLVTLNWSKVEELHREVDDWAARAVELDAESDGDGLDEGN